MDSEDAVIRDLEAVLVRAKRFGIGPSWSNRAWLMGWGSGLLIGVIGGMIIPELLSYLLLK
jgi:hypothetical protein